MNISQKTLVYPFGRKALPLIAYLLDIGFPKENLQAVAFSGLGLKGKDVAYINDGRELGVIVQENFEEALKGCDQLFIMPDYIEETKARIISAMKRALKLGKEVYCAAELSELESADLIKIAAGRNNFHYMSKSKFPNNLNKRMYPIKTPVVLVCDLFGNLSSAEIFLRVIAQFRKNGYNVCGISADHSTSLIGVSNMPDEFFSKSLAENEKIMQLNYYLHKLEQNDPELDLFVIHAPDGAMMFSKNKPVSFGVYLYFISTAIPADYTVLSAPFNLIDQGRSIDACCTAIESRFGFKVGAAVASNVLLNSAEKDVKYIYTDYKQMDTHLNDMTLVKPKLFSIAQEDTFLNLYKDIVHTLSAG
jgi:peptide maturation system protein (TIGR04066 family)